jgi:hypothetical protein
MPFAQFWSIRSRSRHNRDVLLNSRDVSLDRGRRVLAAAWIHIRNYVVLCQMFCGWVRHSCQVWLRLSEFRRRLVDDGRE